MLLQPSDELIETTHGFEVVGAFTEYDFELLL
jgi:hypothetical protein